MANRITTTLGVWYITTTISPQSIIQEIITAAYSHLSFLSHGPNVSPNNHSSRFSSHPQKCIERNMFSSTGNQARNLFWNWFIHRNCKVLVCGTERQESIRSPKRSIKILFGEDFFRDKEVKFKDSQGNFFEDQNRCPLVYPERMSIHKRQTYPTVGGKL